MIDPRRDCEVYLRIAREQGARITCIFETHRNEDYVIGSCGLADRTGAGIYHGKQMDFDYGNPVSHGDTFGVGDARLSVLHTPGHTMESISIALVDTGFGDSPVGVFTGDALFVGDVGRTDFFPDRAAEVAEMLYESLHQTLLPLGDGVIVYPAHGSGSVCGDAMASREFTTLGYERRCNARLQLDRQEFVDFKTREHHYKPPYFRMMEKLNREGDPVSQDRSAPTPLSVEEFAAALEDGAVVVDVRSPEASAGARLVGSLSIPLNMLPTFAGWFLPYDRPLALVGEDSEQVWRAARYLDRIAYNDLVGYLEDGLHGWASSGREFESIPQVTARDLEQRLDSDEPLTLLDVRRKKEFEEGHLPGASQIYVGQLADRIDEVPSERPVVTFCDTGRRAMIAASVLRRAGLQEVQNCLGSLSACRALGCDIITG